MLSYLFSGVNILVLLKLSFIKFHLKVWHYWLFVISFNPTFAANEPT